MPWPRGAGGGAEGQGAEGAGEGRGAGQETLHTHKLAAPAWPYHQGLLLQHLLPHL